VIRPRYLAFLWVVATLAGCNGSEDTPPLDGRGTESSARPERPEQTEQTERSPANQVPLTRPVREALGRVIAGLDERRLDVDALGELGGSEDPRVLWLVADLLRLFGTEERRAAQSVFTAITGVALDPDDWGGIRNHLIAGDTPAYPGYREDKRNLFLRIDSRWKPFFDDEDSLIDWRMVDWGGVLMDDRTDGGPGRRCYRCIPALDDPPVTDATGGDWYPEDALVFGVVINGESRAYPKNIMEVHEMVNDELGGRRFAMPYCTLCGSAQAYFTDDVAGFRPLLRTSGLLSRSNKFSFDLYTMSAIDTFTGRAISGPLLDAGVRLTPIAVVVSSWGAWKADYPDTTIVAEDGGVPGWRYPEDPLGGRDDNGPIFPVGDVDPRLPVQERVLGVVAPDGVTVAFPVAEAALSLEAGEAVEYDGISLTLDGDGLRARIDQEDAGAHESFWFAWSQFHPDTRLWRR